MKEFTTPYVYRVTIETEGLIQKYDFVVRAEVFGTEKEVEVVGDSLRRIQRLFLDLLRKKNGNKE